MENQPLQVVYDHEADSLDELGELFEHWKRNRDKGRTPSAIRAAILMTMEEIIARRKLGRIE